MKRTEENDKVLEYKTETGKAKMVVERVKAEAIEGLYDQLENVKGQQEIYRITAATDQSGMDICQIHNVRSATVEVLMKNDESNERWGQYFNMLMNKANQRVETEESDPSQAMTRNISEEETYTALKGMKCGSAVRADDNRTYWMRRGNIWATLEKRCYVNCSTAF